MAVSLIVAVSRDHAIGRDGALPWRASEDLAHFKRTTMGHTLVVGRKTWDSMGPLPGRRFVVVSRTRIDDLPTGCSWAPSPAAGLEQAHQDDPDPIVAGGAAIYEALLPEVERVHRTTIDLHVPDADTWFPELSPREWQLAGRTPGVDERLIFDHLVRIPPMG